MEELEQAIGGLIIVIGAILIVFIIAKYNYLIKKAMIEKGIVQTQTANRLDYVDIALIVVGLGVGLLIAAYVSTFNLSEDTLDLLVWGIILICGATGMVIAQVIKRRIGR